MKRIISIMLIMMMTSMCILGGFAPVSAETGSTPPAGALVLTPGQTNEIKATKYTSLSGSGTKKEGSNISFQNKGVATFDIWVQEAGNYSFSMKYGTSASTKTLDFTISLNGTDISNPSFPGTTGYTNYESGEACVLTLNAGLNTIKVTNTGKGCYFNAIIFDPYTNIALSEFSTNLSEDVLTATSGIARGTDSFTIRFNNKHNKNTVTAGSVILNDEAGNPYPIAVSTDGVAITVALKKSLEYSKSYTFILNGIEDVYGISTIQNKVIGFTASAEDMGGEMATISVLESSFDEEEIYIKSKTVSSVNMPIEGRQVTVSVLKPDGTPVAEPIYTGISGEEGINIINTSLPASCSISGIYTLLIACEYATSSELLSMPYVTEGDKIEFIEDIDEAKVQAEPATAVKGIYAEKANILGIDIETDTQQLPNADRVFLHIANDAPTTGEEIITKYEKYVALEKMNQAMNTEQIEEVLNNEKLCGYLGFSSERLDLIINEKSSLIEAILNLDEEEEDASQFIQAVNRLIEEAYANEYSIPAVDIETSNVSCYVSQIATADIKLDAAADKVTSVKVVVSADDATVLENLSVTAEEGFTAKVEDVEGAKEIIFASEEVKDAVEKVGTIEFNNTATNKVYNLTVNGEVTYDVGEELPEAKTIFAQKTFTITVSANTNTGESIPTSRPSLAPSRPSKTEGTVVHTPPAVKEEPKEEPKEDEPKDEYNFSDLNNFDWAEEAIYELTDMGIISKSADNQFAPSRNVTRAEFVKMVIVAFGLEEQGLKAELSDVAEDAWYNSYVAAAQKHGIVSGDAEGRFNGDESISRQDMAVIIKRAFEKKGLTIKDQAGETFADDNNIAEYAKEAVYMMKSVKIINGMGENTFAPKDNATRAQAAKVIYETVKAVASK